MKTVQFYNVCLDEASVNRRGDAPLKDLIDRMGGWNVTGNMTSLSTMNIVQRIGKITSELFIKPFIDVRVFYDPHDSSKHIIQVRTTVVGLQLDSHPNNPVRRASGCKIWEVAVFKGPSLTRIHVTCLLSNRLQTTLNTIAGFVQSLPLSRKNLVPAFFKVSIGHLFDNLESGERNCFGK